MMMSTVYLYLQLYQACDVANLRGGRFISIEDFLFLMRKDKVTDVFIHFSSVYLSFEGKDNSAEDHVRVQFLGNVADFRSKKIHNPT